MPVSFLDFLFPRYSLTGREGEWVTAEEGALLRSRPVVLEAPHLRMHGLRALDSIVAAADYRSAPLLRRAVHTFKYRRVPGLGKALGGMLTEASAMTWKEDGAVEAPVLCPVPLHWSRRFTRGFNQAELLAEHVRRARGWPVVSLLRRVHATGHQARRNRPDRFAAMGGAFAVRVRTAPPPPFVILVDDLSTTGATLDACAAALKAAGAERVEGLVIARG